MPTDVGRSRNSWVVLVSYETVGRRCARTVRAAARAAHRGYAAPELCQHVRPLGPEELVIYGWEGPPPSRRALEPVAKTQ